MRLSRGQTLAMFAVSLLLLSLMVVLTLAMAMRVRERIELQNLADAAAYSEAVATARTFNMMGVINRTQWALLVAQTTTQALDDWTIEYYGAVLKVGSYSAGWSRGSGRSRVTCGALTSAASSESSRVMGIWNALDKAGVGQVRDLNVAEAAIQGPKSGRFASTRPGGTYVPNLDNLLTNMLSRQQLAQKVVDAAQSQDPWGRAELSAPPRADQVSLRETDYTCTVGAACWGMLLATGGQNDNHQYEIYMGSRGDSFTTGRRGAVPNALGTDLTRNIRAAGDRYFTANWTPQGSSYQSDQTHLISHDGNNGPLYGSSESDGEGVLQFNESNCRLNSPSFVVGSHTWANLEITPGDHHEATDGPPSSGVVLFSCPNSTDRTHTLIGDIAGGNWPIVVDYNQDPSAVPVCPTGSLPGDGADNYGQPKLVAVIQRDYARRSPLDVWNMNFYYQFGRRGGGEQFDARGERTTAGTNIAMQTAYATGIAYYHRGDALHNWGEQANFMNPFWRATLVRSDIDCQSDPYGSTPGRDIGNTLTRVSSTEGVNALNALVGKGFRGLQ